jgi:4-hydroxybenzoate polyprenyltransferase
MGWAATHGSMNYAILAPLYLSGVTWTLVYDTIYAHQDKHDDAKLGLHTTALSFGDSDDTQKRTLTALATATWLQWLWVGQQADLASIYSIGATASFAHLLWQIRTADLNDPTNLAARFRSNSTVGALMFASFTAGSYFA